MCSLRLATVHVERKQQLELTSLSLQVQNSPLKTLLEIIVKHQIKNGKSNSNENDPLYSIPTLSSNDSSSATTLMSDTMTDSSKHINLRYLTRDF